ncbi:MAG: hypothetical protein IPK27_21515 [Rhodanobacteraceae bacterium]|nr:hypothetical protein [Rhodanobacteraceae bacterium]
MNARSNPAAVELANSIGAFLEISLSDAQKALLMENDSDGGATELIFHTSRHGGFIQVVAADKSGARAVLTRVTLMRMATREELH